MQQRPQATVAMAVHAVTAGTSRRCSGTLQRTSQRGFMAARLLELVELSSSLARLRSQICSQAGGTSNVRRRQHWPDCRVRPSAQHQLGSHTSEHGLNTPNMRTTSLSQPSAHSPL